ncbi:MAG: Asp-tRNA(Asn)/Glu-tRNA(Gln) amidotransferase subunit GatB, partial [Antricoccus sp.]
YPDMPKNFQTSQFDEPLCVDGYLDVTVEGRQYRVDIERVHLEEDTGKSLHVGGATGRIQGATHSLVDFNRAGIPLVEVVTRPIAGTGEHVAEVARNYATALREICRELGISDVRMEQGSMRCDVNLSLNKPGAEMGTRSETKNVNSLRSIERAIRSEIIRQAPILDGGGSIMQETRHFHEDSGQTTSGRSKEEATDYRYFPEPDLVPMAPAAEYVARLKAELPELPAAREARLQSDWGLSDPEMSALIGAGALGVMAQTIAAGASAAEARKWWTGDLARRANDSGIDLDELTITPAQVAQIAQLVRAGEINDKLARQVLDGVLAGEGDPEQVMHDRGLVVVSDTDTLGAAVDEAITANPDIAAKIRDGKVQAAGALVGAVMKSTRGQADAALVRTIILERLQESTQ